MKRKNNFDKPIEVLVAENYASSYIRKLCSFEDYIENFTLGILDGSEQTWELCFDTMPSGVKLVDYVNYLNIEIVAHNFMPYVNPDSQFRIPITEAQAKLIERERKPKYVALVAFAKKRLLDQKLQNDTR